MTLAELNDLIRTTSWLSNNREDAIYAIANYTGSAEIGTVLRIVSEDNPHRLIYDPLFSTVFSKLRKIGNNSWTGLPLIEEQNTRKIAESIFWIMKHLGSSCKLIKEEDYQYESIRSYV